MRAVRDHSRVVTNLVIASLLRRLIRHLSWLDDILEHEDAASLQFLIFDDAA